MNTKTPEKFLDDYKLKNLNDIIKFINFDALDYEENKDFLKEVTSIRHSGCDIFGWLDIDIVLYPYFGTFILKSRGIGRKLLELLRNDYCNLREMKIKLADIKYLKSFARTFDIDLEIKKGSDSCYRAYLCGKRSFY